MAHQINKQLFVSIIPGNTLEEEISEVIKYCKVNDCYAQLEFNGHTNWISKLTSKSISHIWYDIRTRKEDIIAQTRNDKINSILNN